MNRERRKTAGQRMTSLVGKAQEEDDTFWGHDTWAEDDSGNESFRESDEDSTQRKDVFDSDFDDSESDNEDEEEAAGEQEEREIEKQERSNRQKKNNYTDITKGGRAMLQKAKGVRGKGSKRAIGNGINAGLVLNLPPSRVDGGVISANPPGSLVPAVPLAVKSSSSPQSPSTKRSRMTSELDLKLTLATARQRRSQTKKRDSRNSTPTYSDISSQHSNKRSLAQVGVTKKSRRRQYMQEELLLEAVKETEPENQRWLLARKRVQDSADQDHDAMAALRDKNRGKNVIQKYHSRRGCLITLTFPEMDAVPEFLTRKNEQEKKQDELTCAITGKIAKYRDPKTGEAYFDAAAFKELRRRHKAGEPLDQRPKAKPKPADGEATAVNGDGASVVSETKAASVRKASPKTPPFILDLGGDKKSPGSTRSSGRKWKPSEKMLHGVVGVTKESGTTPKSKGVDTAILEAAPELPSMALTSKSNAKDSAVTDATNHSEQNTESKPTMVSSKTTLSTNKVAPTVASAEAVGVSESLATSDVSSEKVYVVPSSGNGTGTTPPRYVTQSELIMQAISNYNRSATNEHQPLSNGNDQGTPENAS